MGSCCPNFFSRRFRLYHPEPQNSLNFEIFSNENDGFFYTPSKYTDIKTNLTKIINLSSSQWSEHKNFLYESKSYLLESLGSLDNFLFQEDNNLENSLPKDTKFQEIPSLIQMSVIKNLDKEFELNQARTSTISSYKECNQKFIVKKFILEIKRLVFLGDNNPEALNLTAPRVELKFVDALLNNISKNKIFCTKSNKQSLNPIWNEVFEVDLQSFLEVFPFHQIHFSISIFYEEKLQRKSVLLGESQIFSFRELENQMIYEKAVNLRGPNENAGGFIAVLYFRCQLIHDYFKFLNSWKNEIEVKLEIINRLIQKIAFDEKSQKFIGIAMNNYKQENLCVQEIASGKAEEKRKNPKNFQNFSLMSGENSEINGSSIYDNQYYLK